MSLAASVPPIPCAPAASASGVSLLGDALARVARTAPQDLSFDVDCEAIALIRGASTEQRVLRVLLTGIAAAVLPPWLLAVRLGTSVEDRAGVDIVATCDDGDHGLQVKSSHCGLLKFIAQRALLAAVQPRGIVVVHGEMPDRLVRGQVIAALNTLRLERRLAAEGAR